FVRGKGYYRVGELHGRLGDREAARDAYGCAIALFEPLVAQFPHNGDYAVCLSGCRGNLGNALAALGKSADAEREYRGGIATGEPFAARADCRATVAVNNQNFGRFLWELGRRPEALEVYRRAIDIEARLCDDYPAVLTYQSDLAYSRESLGTLLRQSGDRAGAASAYRHALTIRLLLASNFPNVPAYRVALATTHQSLGSLASD